MRGSLHFEDGHEGSIVFRADFINGKSDTSNAHRVMAQCIKFLDDQAASKLEPLEETIDVAPRPEVSRIIH